MSDETHQQTSGTPESVIASPESAGANSRRCPWCAEEIRAEALRCPHCRSRLASFERGGWHRDHPEARLAGVAAALAHAFSVPVAAVRLGFVVLTFLHFLGPILYVFGWLVIPQTPEHGSLAEGLVSSIGSSLRHEQRQWHRRHRTHCDQAPASEGEGAKSERTCTC